jgi:hypothetical protein
MGIIQRNSSNMIALSSVTSAPNPSIEITI